MYKERIRAFYDQLSPGYRRIAEFLLSHYRDAAFMTAAEIARSVRVDTALVVRFAQRLGYPGFPELIEEVQEEVKQDLRAVYEPVEGGDSPLQIIRRNLLQDRNNLDYMLQHLDEDVVVQVIEFMRTASRIFMIGEGNLSALAEAFCTRLVSLGYPAHPLSSEILGQAAVIAGMHPDDLLIGLSSTSMASGVATAIKVTRERGVRTVAVVPSVTNPVATSAQHILVAPVLAAGIVPSWTGIAAVLHALSQALTLSIPEGHSEWLMRTDQTLKAYNETLRAQVASLRDVMASHNLAQRQAEQ